MKKIFEEQKKLETPKAKYGDVEHRIIHLLYVFKNKIKTQLSKKEEPKKTEPEKAKEEPKVQTPSTQIVKPKVSTQKPETDTQQLKSPQETQNKAPETQKGDNSTGTPQPQK